VLEDPQSWHPDHGQRFSGGSVKARQKSIDGNSLASDAYDAYGGLAEETTPNEVHQQPRGSSHLSYGQQPSNRQTPTLGPPIFSPEMHYPEANYTQYQQQQPLQPPQAFYQSYDYNADNPVQQQRPSSLRSTNQSQPLLRAMSSATSLGPLRTPPSLASTKRSNGQPITKAAIDEYRNRIKADPDPEIQFNFAKYLIEAARKLGQACSTAPADEAKSLKRYRDALLQESVKLIKKIATQSSGPGKLPFPDAQFFYANCLSSGSLGLSVDHEKAYTLYVQASKQNHPAATYRTAVSNEVGAGTKKDPNRAVLFYRKASALGDTAGMYKLGMILLNGHLFQQRNGREAVLWLKRAAQQADEDHPHALHELGLLYERPPNPNGPLGPTVPLDDAQALELFTQAAKLGYGPSQHKLGMTYEYGNLTCMVDPRRSIAYYTRAAERGEPESELALSGWYLTGMFLKSRCTNLS